MRLLFYHVKHNLQSAKKRSREDVDDEVGGWRDVDDELDGWRDDLDKSF